MLCKSMQNWRLQGKISLNLKLKLDMTCSSITLQYIYCMQDLDKDINMFCLLLFHQMASLLMYLWSVFVWLHANVCLAVFGWMTLQF